MNDSAKNDSANGEVAALDNISMGFGTWSWGDRLFWGYGRGYNETDIKIAFDSAIAAGITLFDTAEVYGQGKSESLLGQFITTTPSKIMIASKFMPFPWRLSPHNVVKALKGSLSRLNLKQIDLYQLHMPLPPLPIERWMEGLAEAMDSGLTRSVGISNFDIHQTEKAYEALVRMGVKLTSNQIEYNLLNRKAEKSGLITQCKDLGIRVIAYSPLAMGLLTGKYTPENPPQGLRGRRFNTHILLNIQPMISLLKKIGAKHDGKSASQVALNWNIKKGTLPIPGIKNNRQVAQNIDALGWSLNEEEIHELDTMSDQIDNQGYSKH